MTRLHWSRLIFNRFTPFKLVGAALLLVSLKGAGQQSAELASLHGVIRDAEVREQAIASARQSVLEAGLLVQSEIDSAVPPMMAAAIASSS